MSRFTVDLPAGWTRSPFPAPQAGLYLHPPAGGPRGVLLLMDELAPQGTLGEQLTAAVRTGCADGELRAQDPPVAFTAGGLPGLSVATRVWVRQHDELRVFSLIDAGTLRLPIVFLGEVGAGAVYRPAIEHVLSTIRREGAPPP